MSNVRVVFREAQEFDYPALVEIGHKFFAFNSYRHYTNIDEPSLIQTFELLRTQHILLVAEAEIEFNSQYELIGTAGAFVAPLFWNANYLQGVEAFWWIEPEYRGGSAGKQLREALENAAKDKGVQFWSMIALKESMHDQVCAQYERAGLKPVETVYMKVL